MSSNDLELEEGLKNIGNKLASPPSDLHQLLLLLDKAENLLSRVEQSPSASLFVALRPVMKALIAKDLMGHSDMDVKVTITYCLSEITRITAPDAPYDDDLMKEIFGLIVGAFKNLDDMSSRAFPKRVSILETVAKVRSCVLMLDLDCDDLILEMFHHFLKTIRSKHSDTVFSSMETVMTLVLEESENISSQVLSCVLDCLKIVEKNILTAAKKLAEKVLVNCSLKLKPCLVELFNDSGALLSDYNKIVAAVFHGNVDSLIQNETNASAENQGDDHKLLERTLSDDLPQGSAQQESEIFHPEKAVAAADKSSKSLMCNGSFQIGNVDSMDSEQKNESRHHNGKSNVNTGASLVDSDILNSGTSKPDGRSNISSRKRGRNALSNLSISNDHDGVGNRKKVRANSGRRKGSSKEAEIISQADGPSKVVESVVCSKIEKKNELELASDSPDVAASASFHSPSEHDGTRSRRGRLSESSAKRNTVDKAAEGGLSTAGHKEFSVTSQAKSPELPIRDLISNGSEALGDSKRKQLTGSTKKSRSGSAKDDQDNATDSKSTPTTATSDSDTKLLSNRGANRSQRKLRVNFSEKKQSDGTKQPKRVKHAEADDKEVKLKEWLAPQKSRVKELVKDYNQVKDTDKTQSRRKSAQGTQETFGPRKRSKGLDDTIVGSKIKIWWPDDQSYYDGVIDSFDQNTKMHKILYVDGDVEVLLLKKEQWQFIEGETKMDGEKDKPHVNTSETSKKAKGSTSVAIDKTTDSPPKSPDPPGVSGPLTKQRPRRRVKTHSDEVKSSSVTSKKSRNRHPEESHNDNNQTEVDTPKTSRRLKHGPPKIRGKVLEDTPKSKSDGGSSRSTRKSRYNIHSPMKESGVSNDPVSNSLETSIKPESAGGRRKPNLKSAEGRRNSIEGSPKLKSAEGRRKTGRMQGKGLVQKGKAIRSSNEKGTLGDSQAKIGKTDAGSSGKKRKKARIWK